MYLSACLDYQREDDLCPNCGDFGVLSEVTGWCSNCSIEYTIGEHRCLSCGAEVPVSHDRQICWDCKQEQWLMRYANLIEMVMITGPSFTLAVTMVKDIIRPICACCGVPIRGGHPGESMFCSAKPRCIKARHKYRRLLKKGTDPRMAVELAVRG